MAGSIVSMADMASIIVVGLIITYLVELEQLVLKKSKLKTKKKPATSLAWLTWPEFVFVGVVIIGVVTWLTWPAFIVVGVVIVGLI